jgi:hypothetical protein
MLDPAIKLVLLVNQQAKTSAPMEDIESHARNHHSAQNHGRFTGD